MYDKKDDFDFDIVKRSFVDAILRATFSGVTQCISKHYGNQLFKRPLVSLSF